MTTDRVLMAIYVTVALAWSAAVHALDQATLTGYLTRVQSEQKLPGLRAAVMLPNGKLVHAAVGMADKEREIALDDTIGMPGGSTGKTFVATLTMLLVEDEVLSLDDPASKYLGHEKWFWKLPNAKEIRVRHLLSHSSGLGDYPGSVRFNMAMVGRVLRHGSAYFSPEELIRLGRRRGAQFTPGTGYRYTDVGYLVLGRVIEAASGESYYTLLRKRILKPHGLELIRPQEQSALPHIAVGYQGGVSNLKKDGRMKLDPRTEWTGGGLVTTPIMLVLFYDALANGRIVSEDSLKLMLESGYRNLSHPGWRYGFGVFVGESTHSFGHGGRWSGYRSHVAHLQNSGMTIAIQTNSDGRIDMIRMVRDIAILAQNEKEESADGR